VGNNVWRRIAWVIEVLITPAPTTMRPRAIREVEGTAHTQQANHLFVRRTKIALSMGLRIRYGPPVAEETGERRVRRSADGGKGGTSIC
jgi:hypothetical protein